MFHRSSSCLSRAARASLALTLLAGASCSSLGLSSPMDDLNLSPVAVATTTGAVLGGGLGAIVGAEGGNAGAGLVIGAVAGGAAGGLVGRELQASDEGISVQSEKLRRQKEVLDTQRREIEELKRNSESPLAVQTRKALQGQQLANASQRPSLPAPAKEFGRPMLSGPSGNAGRFRARPYSEVMKEESALKTYAAKSQLNAPPPKRIKMSEPSLAPAPVKAKLITPSLPAAKASEKPADDLAAVAEEMPSVKSSATPKNDSGLPPAKTETAAAHDEEGDTEIGADTASLAPEAEKVKPSAKLQVASAPAKAPDAPVPSESSETAKGRSPAAGDDCAKAEEEAKRARAALSEADQLFYLRRALRLCPKGAQYHVDIGKVYTTLGRVEDAEFEFRQALEIDPQSSAAQAQLSALQKK